MKAYIQDYPEWVSTAIDRLKELPTGYYDSWKELDHTIAEIVSDDIWWYDRFYHTALLHWAMYPTENLHWLVFVKDDWKRIDWVCEIYTYAYFDHKECKPFLIEVSEINIS